MLAFFPHFFKDGGQGVVGGNGVKFGEIKVFFDPFFEALAAVVEMLKLLKAAF